MMERQSELEVIEQMGQSMQDCIMRLEDVVRASTMKMVVDNDLPAGVDRLIYNHCLNQTQLMRLLNMNDKQLKALLTQLLEQELIEPPFSVGVPKYYNRRSIATIFEYLNLPRYRDKYAPMITAIKNQKGGTGKSSSAVTLATGSALDFSTNAKVLLCDLDPQGTAGISMIRECGDNPLFITLIDILLADYEPDGQVAQLLSQGLTLSDIIANCAFSTHLPNLFAIPAFPTDQRINNLCATLDEEQQIALFDKFTNIIAPLLKEHYDIVIFDTAPQDSAVTQFYLDAIDFVVVPVMPNQYDFVSTAQFITQLAVRGAEMPGRAANLKRLKVLMTNFDESDYSMHEIRDNLIESAGTRMFSNYFKHSDVFTEAARKSRTVLDLMQSEAATPDKDFKDGVTSAKNVLNEFLSELKKVARGVK